MRNPIVERGQIERLKDLAAGKKSFTATAETLHAALFAGGNMGYHTIFGPLDVLKADGKIRVLTITTDGTPMTSANECSSHTEVTIEIL